MNMFGRFFRSPEGDQGGASASVDKKEKGPELGKVMQYVQDKLWADHEKIVEMIVRNHKQLKGEELDVDAERGGLFFHVNSPDELVVRFQDNQEKNRQEITLTVMPGGTDKEPKIKMQEKIKDTSGAVYAALNEHLFGGKAEKGDC